MKVKCKLCGLKGYWDDSNVSEFFASRFLFISFGFNKNSHFICRNCLRRILEALSSESFNIERLHKPEIKGDNHEK